jgi:pimeloyl-ACP methyl ester carboxylesterase
MAASRPVRHSRPFLSLVAICLLGSLLGLPSATAGPTSPSAAPATALPVPELRWTDCGDGFQCATARVPLDYDKPRGARISLALIRLPATDPARKLGSIFLNPGGPGTSGVDLVRRAGRLLYSDQVRERFDLVGFDPRGIIRSTPLRCFTSLQQAQAAQPPFPFPVTGEEERVWIRSDRRIARACVERAGAIIDHMATANVARDLDLLRRAVGDRRLSYAGYSYGSYLGTTYANLFPNKVRALLVDGIPDPIAWATGRGDQARTQPLFNRQLTAQGSYATLLEFFRLCDRGGPNCAFSQGDPRRRYAALARRLLAEPAQLPDQTVTYADLVVTTLLALYEPELWPDLAVFLQQLDTLTAPRAAAAALQALRTRLGASQQEDYPNLLEGQFGVFCSDSDNPATVGAWKRAARASDRRFPYFGRPWTWLSSLCQPWPGRDADRYTGPFTKRTSNPVLIVGNRFDPASRYQGAVTLSRLLPRSRLLTLDGWGHTSVVLPSSCIAGHVNRYLLTTRVPPPGTVCPPDLVPFAQPASRTASGRLGRVMVDPPMPRRTAQRLTDLPDPGRATGPVWSG